MIRGGYLLVAGVIAVFGLARPSEAQHSYFFGIESENIQKELGLSGDGLEKALEISREYREAFSALRRDTWMELFDPPSVSQMPEERLELLRSGYVRVLKAMKEPWHELMRKHMDQLRSVLSEEQDLRLQGIALQFRPGGFAVLLPQSPDIAGALDLSEEQMQQIWAILESDVQSAESFDAMEESKGERDKKVLALFTEDQRRKLETLQGEPVDVEQIRRETLELRRAAQSRRSGG